MRRLQGFVRCLALLMVIASGSEVLRAVLLPNDAQTCVATAVNNGTSWVLTCAGTCYDENGTASSCPLPAVSQSPDPQYGYYSYCPRCNFIEPVCCHIVTLSSGGKRSRGHCQLTVSSCPQGTCQEVAAPDNTSTPPTRMVGLCRLPGTEG